MRYTRLTVIAAISLFVIETNSWAAPIYDAAADFEAGWIAKTNPNGVWSYGYSAGFTNPVTLYDQTAPPPPVLNGPQAQYWLSSSVNTGDSPSAEYNNGPPYDDGNVDFSANEFLLVAGIDGQYSDLIFTSPTNGMYSLASSFTGSQFGIGTVVAVLANDVVLFNSSVTANGQVVPFDTDVRLTAGEMVEFSVGPGGGTQNTGVSATIAPLSAVPEPASVTLFGTALAALGLVRRRRKLG